MKSVKRWRHYCDFCKKSGMQRHHMAAHEARCTMNPQRQCGVCAQLNGGYGLPLPEMLAALPDPAQFVRKMSEDLGLDLGTAEWEEHDDDGMRTAVNAALPKLREMTDDCPVCILAALRQKGIPVPVVDAFNFSKEFEAARTRMNEVRAENQPGCYGSY